MVVWKYKLSPLTKLRLPSNSQIAHVGEQDDELFIWVVIYDENDMSLLTRKFFVLPTGRSVKSADGWLEVDFVGTVQMKSGLVFHVFEDLRDDVTASRD